MCTVLRCEAIVGRQSASDTGTSAIWKFLGYFPTQQNLCYALVNKTLAEVPLYTSTSAIESVSPLMPADKNGCNTKNSAHQKRSSQS